MAGAQYGHWHGGKIRIPDPHGVISHRTGGLHANSGSSAAVCFGINYGRLGNLLQYINNPAGGLVGRPHAWQVSTARMASSALAISWQFDLIHAFVVFLK